MSKLPAFQFYPGDWLKDPALRRCSQAARGVWIDLLCLMFECEERGVLATAGRPWTNEEIARVIAGDQSLTITCIMELLGARVVSRNRSGALFSRRLVRDEIVRAQTRERVSRHRSNGDVTHDVRPPSSSPSSQNLKDKTRAPRVAPIAEHKRKLEAINRRWDAVVAEFNEAQAGARPEERQAAWLRLLAGNRDLAMLSFLLDHAYNVPKN